MADSILQMLGIRPADVNLLRDRGVPLDQPMPYDPSYQVPGSPPAQRVGDVAGGALQALPSVGDAYSVLQAIADLEAGNYGDAAWNGVAALPMVAGMGAIKVFHGSPHKFDAFDMSKIGTGEGAQAYGHGLYFAENEGIADFYRKELSDTLDVDIAGTKVDESVLMPMERGMLVALRDKGHEAGMAELDKMKDTAPAVYKSWKGAFDAGLVSVRDERGALYETSLEWPDPAREASDPLGPQHFLDWDKPLSEQESILAKLKQAGVFSGEKKFDTWSALVGPGGVYVNPEDAAQRAYIATQQDSGANTASELFKSAGIPGIRYLDQGSRGAGDGTYNYVVFDDKIPKIVSRK
jgi:hypothetical protein